MMAPPSFLFRAPISQSWYHEQSPHTIENEMKRQRAHRMHLSTQLSRKASSSFRVSLLMCHAPLIPFSQSWAELENVVAPHTPSFHSSDGVLLAIKVPPLFITGSANCSDPSVGADCKYEIMCRAGLGGGF